ncbi:MAG: Bacterial regulatory protein Fis family, partial [Verrucomicrobiota bacterium]
ILEARCLAPDFVFPDGGFSLERAIDELVQRALRQAGGNVSGAARLLGVSRDVVRYRLKTAAEERGPGEISPPGGG